MALDTQTNDWKVCMLFNAAGGVIIAGGTFRFVFYSDTAGVSAGFKFYGMGIGEGGDISGFVLPLNIGPFGPWSDLECDQKFSAWDLNGCWGRISSIGAGAGLVFGPMMITAAKRFFSTTSLFHSQNVGGFGGGGAGAGGSVLIGGWHYMAQTHYSPSNLGADSSTTMA